MNEPISSRKLNDRILQMFSLMRLVRQGARPGCGPRGFAQERALRTIGEREGITQRDLMVDMNLRPSSLSELLSKLETGGLIERRQNEDDRRVVNLFLKDQGRAMLNRMGDEQSEPDLFAGLTEAEKYSYLLLTEKIIAGLLETCDALGIPAGEPDGHRGRPDMPPPPPHHGRPDMPPPPPFGAPRPGMRPPRPRFEEGHPYPLRDRPEKV